MAKTNTPGGRPAGGHWQDGDWDWPGASTGAPRPDPATPAEEPPQAPVEPAPAAHSSSFGGGGSGGAGGGLLLAVVLYPVALAYLRGGWTGVRNLARAKFLNKTTTAATGGAGNPATPSPGQVVPT